MYWRNRGKDKVMKYGNEEIRLIWWIENEYSWQLFKNITRKMIVYKGPDIFALAQALNRGQFQAPPVVTRRVANK